MASYKVAQDVEAEDKLLGPFSFRQFIYLVIAAMAGVVAWGLSRVFVGLAIIPAPIILFFVILALPLRKDQPMEVYLAAIVSYHLKPRRRLWQPDGVQSLIEVVATHTEDQQLTKNISGSEAERRLAYLATLADTQGWSIRNISNPPQQVNPSMIDDAYNDAQSTPDNFDDDSGLARSLDTMIDKADAARRQTVIDQMRAPQPTPSADIVMPSTPAEHTADPQISFNPYPTAMRQHVISPTGPPAAQAEPSQPAPPVAAATTHAPAEPSQPAPAAQPTPAPPTNDNQTTSEKPLSPDIINLANNKDLTVETIAREAKRINAKQHDASDEVVISLR